MRPIEKIVIFVGLAVALVAGGIFLPEIFSKSTNCGGNTYALGACRNNALIFWLAANDRRKNFNVNQLSLEDRTQIVRTSQTGWIPGGKIFVRVNIDHTANPKQIVAVCDKPFGNVPQPTFWNGYRRNFAHAVGYMDGSSGLISPADFKKLNLSQFIDASLVSTNAEGTTVKSVSK